MTLDLDHSTMQKMGRRVADLVAAHLASLRAQRILGPGLHPLTRVEADRLLATPAPEKGQDFEKLIAWLEERVLPYHAREPHPGFIAYVPSCPTFPAVMGDWLATGFNFFAGVWAVSPGPTRLELQVLEWFREWIGMPEGSGGLLTSGASQATVTAMIAARHAAVGEEPDRLPRLAVYTSDQAHSAATRAAWIAGVPRGQIRILPSDDRFRLPVEAVAQAIAEDRYRGLIPLMVVASAGTTNTGAVDPLPELADLCRREEVWFHVDAAYGGFAALTEEGQAALEGLGRADSVTLDPHKWLFVPFECGGLLVKDPETVASAFRIYPEYLKDVETEGHEVNFADYGEQLTRYNRALKVWLSVSYYGLAKIRAAIEEGIRRAEAAEAKIRKNKLLEVLAPAQLGIVCFRAHPKGMDAQNALNEFNERVLQKVNSGGRYFISSTRLRGAFALRICAPGFRTTRDDMARVISEVAEAGMEVGDSR